ncbi:MAG TPA: hypothetical protein VGT02_14130 [Methylomirabilota bacterium]|jgi:hypothetical protein|nr:hypothetical protein [Methylomirabilota bacterium]
MPTPTVPLPAVAETWISRSKYLRWLDALAAWLVGLGAILGFFPEAPGGTAAVVALVLVAAGSALQPLRIRWRPVSGWVGVVVSKSLRPGARAWFVRDGRADAVLITARHGLRMSIAPPGFGEAETMRVRRTRVFLVPLG